MRLVYITSYAFPSTRAEPYYVKSMAEAFAELMGKDFLLVVRGHVPTELEKANAVSVRMPKRFRILWYFLWFPFFVLRKKVYEQDAVLMSNDPHLVSVYVFWRAVLRFKYKICSDWHQLFNDWRDSFVAKNSDYLITTTERLKELIVSECAVDSERVLVAYGGIDLDFFKGKTDIPKSTFRERLQLPTNAFLVAYIGGFKAAGLEKGLTTMIKALPYLDEHIKMVFVGGSKDYDGEYPVLAEKLGVSHRCIFVGKQPFSKVVEYELAMDVLAIPYPDKPHFRDYGFPLKVWEYMASGRPIVYSDLPIIGEILRGRGVTFTPDNPESFAKAVSSVYEDARTADTMAEQNTRDIHTYTWDERVSKIVEFIRCEKTYDEPKYQ